MAKGRWMDPLQRLLSETRVVDGCWICSHEANRNGYPRVWVGFRANGDRRRLMAHRFVYEHYVGPIPDGFQIDHLCRNRGCIRPDHMELVTSRENTLRGVGPTAQNAAKTHCHKGHPFDAENTRYRPDGKRDCKACQKAYNESRRVAAGYRASPGG